MIGTSPRVDDAPSKALLGPLASGGEHQAEDTIVTARRSQHPSDTVGKARQVEQYVDLFGKNDDEAVSARKRNYVALAKFHYALGAGLYEIGWGRSHHMCPFEKGEAFADGIRRHERYISDRLGLEPGMLVLDVGCGVGGPMREIARYSGAQIVGANVVPEQVEKARRYNEEAGLSKQCEVMLADMMDLPVDDAAYDRIYAIGSTCHAPDRTLVFKELWRVLKPDGVLVADECVMTDSYDPDDQEHRRIKHDIQLGYGIPDLITAEECRRSMVAAGFELLETNDRARTGDPETPWYSPLESSGFSIRAMVRSPIGRRVTNQALGILEALHPSARGSRRVSAIFNAGADATVEGGRKGIVTTLYFMLARKPGGDGENA